MRCLKYAIGLLSLLCCVNILLGQNVVTGKYKGHVVKMKYYKGSPDDIQYLEYGLVTELNKTVSRLEKEKSSLQKELNKLKGKNQLAKILFFALCVMQWLAHTKNKFMTKWQQM